MSLLNDVAFSKISEEDLLAEENEEAKHYELMIQANTSLETG